ncbi:MULTISPECIES: DUF1366 domain-containing protein [unclassified Streptococcus]|uniref:DUF1366 domain-containing protein n=1 Tax=unclassified Streptococcus TaxID=2608887 RepID=UPI00211AFA44|nr:MULTISPECIES: DUF1366 domain-containing protein [unclassified Streptococcus]MCQ9212291.1 DUF1366 domain-containing protein [Streptococcus sp. B01]MCQ9213622.1 DUF1366 domain-containing protein [Streptococcus sp. O1]
MKLEYGSKSQEYDASGTASATKVVLINPDGASVPIFLSPDKIELSNTELLELALEVIYQENFPQRAENEKFNTMGEKIAHVDDAVDKVNAVAQEVKELSATSRGAFLKVMMKLYEKGVLTDEEMEELGLFDEE